MQLLTDNGWTKYYSCFCNGTQKDYWINSKYPEFEIRTRPMRNTFTLLQKNMIIYGPGYTYKLEETLKKYEIFE